MGELLMFLLYASGALAIGALIFSGRGLCCIVREIVRFIQHELLMRPQQRYYMFR